MFLCRYQGIFFAEEVGVSRTNWNLFRSIAAGLLGHLKAHRQQAAVQLSPKVQEVVEWLRGMGMDEQAKIAVQSQLTFDKLSIALSDNSHMHKMAQQLRLSDLDFQLLKKELRARVLSQSIEDWLSSMDMGSVFGVLRDNGCSTFDALFLIHDDEEVFNELLAETGLPKIKAILLKKRVKAKKEEMLGASGAV